MDCIALGAQLHIVVGLKVEASIEIEGGAVIVELGPDPDPIGKYEIHLFRSGQERAADRRGRDAFGPLMLDPFDLRHHRARLNRNAQDDLVLDDQPSHGLFDGAGLRGKNAEQQRHKAQKRPRSHFVAHIDKAGFAAMR
jgi:hypothetical protein